MMKRFFVVLFLLVAAVAGAQTERTTTDVQLAAAAIETIIPPERFEAPAESKAAVLQLAPADCRLQVADAISASSFYKLLAPTFLEVVPKEALRRSISVRIGGSEALRAAIKAGDKSPDVEGIIKEQLKLVYSTGDYATDKVAAEADWTEVVAAWNSIDKATKQAALNRWKADGLTIVTQCQARHEPPARALVASCTGEHQVIGVVPPAQGETAWHVHYRTSSGNGTWEVSPGTVGKSIGRTTCRFDWQ